VITEAFDLAPVRWVIHAVGPIYQGPQDAATLTSAYTQALARADEVGATSVAFPSISTGAYGYPLAQAAAVSMQALCGAVTAVQSVLLVAFNPPRAGTLGAGPGSLTSPKGSLQTMSSCDCVGALWPRGWAERSVSALPTWDHPVPVRPGSEAHSALPGAVLTPWSAPVTFGGSQSVDCRPDGNRLQGCPLGAPSAPNSPA